MNERDYSAYSELCSYLTTGNFMKVFEDEESRRDFHRFVRNRAQTVGRFAISFPNPNGLFYFLYPVQESHFKDNKIRLEIDKQSINVFVTGDIETREIPDELKGIPIWHLEEQMKKYERFQIT